MSKRLKAAAKYAPERQRPPLRAKTDRQADYIAAIMSSPQVFSLGCAGTGKTYIAATVAADLLLANRISKIVLTRPNVAAGQSLGFFPGTLEEKIAPWVAPFIEVLKKRMGVDQYETNLKKGNIEIVPLEVMRGRTFDDAFVILDEAQNTSPHEMKMFLTRIGDGTKVVVNGDIAQSDIPIVSGLATVIRMVKKFNMPVPVIEFTEDDIVRSDICAQWIKAFNKERL